MESRDATRDPIIGVSVSKVSGLVSVSKDFGPRLKLSVSRLCIGYFSWSFVRRSSLKTVLKNDCSKINRSKRSVAKLSLLLCCLRDGENNLPSKPFEIYTEFNKKCACTNETAVRNLCNKRLRVLCKGLSLNCFFRSFVMKPIGLFKRGGRVPKISFLRSQMKPCLFFEVLFKALC